jgi:phenylacetate-CoA ligase
VAVTPSPAEFARRFDGPVASVLPETAARVPVFAARLARAGLEPDELVDVHSLDRLPVLTKDELVVVQADAPPFGGLLAPGAGVRRIFQSPGPLYEAEVEGDDQWRWAPALRAAGFSSRDIVLNAFGYHLTPAGAMFEQAVLALGATVVPAGVGNLELQARACRDLAVTAFIGLPSYLKALLEKAEELGLDPASWPLERAFVAAEPLPGSLRNWLLERLAVVRQGYGTAECGNLGCECEAMDGLHVPEDALVQICDLTSGEALWDGREGQVVATLFSPDYAVVRFGTGDLSAFLLEPCSCGLASPRLAGWLGRVGEAVKVRGMFLHPRQAGAALAGLPQVSGFQFVVERVDDRDVLHCRVVAAPGAEAGAVAESVRTQIQSALRFNAEVELVPELDGDVLIVDQRGWAATSDSSVRAKGSGHGKKTADKWNQ